jgi:hypothetical protein
MAHFAKVENGIVTNVVVVDNTYEANGQEFLNSIGLEGTWVQTSYNANFGKKYAGIGDTFDGENFKPAEPEGNLGFDEEAWSWIMPKPTPLPVEEDPNATNA